MMLLSERDIQLIEFNKPEDYEYLYKLASEHKYNDKTRDELERHMEFYGHKFFTGYANGHRGGVVFSRNIPGCGVTIDGYLDRRFRKDREYSYFASKIMLDFLFQSTEEVYAIFDKLDTKLIRFNKILGFTYEKESEQYYYYKLRRKDYVSFFRRRSRCSRSTCNA